MAIQLAVFDMAGTTVYDQGFVHQAFIAGMQSAGFSVTHDEVNPLMGLHKPQAIKMMLEPRMPAEEITEELIMRIHQVFEDNMVAFYSTDASVREIEGASASFEKLHAAGIKVGINTGFGRVITDAIIARLGWDKGLIDASMASDEVSLGRPAPFMIMALMHKLGIESPANVAKVGDTPVDLEEGQTAECGLVIGVYSGAYTQSQLIAEGIGTIVPSVVEATELILAQA